MISKFEIMDKHIFTFLENNEISLSLTLTIFTLVVFIFFLILAYKTGINELPSNYYKQAYEMKKEAKKLNIESEEKSKTIEKLNKKIKYSMINLYKNKVRFERQAYALLSKELTKESYNEDIDTLADKASEIINEANKLIDEAEENIVKDIYGFED